VRRIAVFMTTTAIVLLSGALPAWAHVTVSPSEAPKGGFATLTFQVPNEEDNATTTKIVVNFPQDQPIADASVQPIPGWSFKVDTTKLTTPITTDEGTSLTEGVKSITWTATDGKGIGAGEFQQFRVSVGLPSDGDALQFDTDQTYSDGNVVHWNQQTPAGGPEPDNPAPTVKLTAGEDGSATPTTAANGSSGNASPTTTSDDSDSAKTIAIIALIVAILGVLAGAAAFVTGRRRTT
jgi:uncharacterized protein YcnI